MTYVFFGLGILFGLSLSDVTRVRRLRHEAKALVAKLGMDVASSQRRHADAITDMGSYKAEADYLRAVVGRLDYSMTQAIEHLKRR